MPPTIRKARFRAASQAAEERRFVSGHDFAENSFWRRFVSGHDFSRAVKLFVFCHPERTTGAPAKRRFCDSWGGVVREGSTFSTFSATSLVMPQRVENNMGFSLCDRSNTSPGVLWPTPAQRIVRTLLSHDRVTQVLSDTSSFLYAHDEESKVSFVSLLWKPHADTKATVALGNPSFFRRSSHSEIAL